ISGLSDATVVIEAGEHSGALITARCAAEQGRDVYVVPGSVLSAYSRGCHRLIKEGACLIESGDELLRNLQPARLSFPAVVGGESIMDPPPEAVGDDEKQILNAVSGVSLSVDELVAVSGMPVDRLAEVLLSLEIKGKIRALPGQRYHRYDSPE